VINIFIVIEVGLLSACMAIIARFKRAEFYLYD